MSTFSDEIVIPLLYPYKSTLFDPRIRLTSVIVIVFYLPRMHLDVLPTTLICLPYLSLTQSFLSSFYTSDSYS